MFRTLGEKAGCKIRCEHSVLIVAGRKQYYYTYFINYGVDIFILSKMLRNLGLAKLEYEHCS